MMMNDSHNTHFNNSKTNLIINYLPQSLSDDQFTRIFSSVGEVRSARIIRKKDGYSYGFGFVDYLSPEDASRAIEQLNGLEIENKRVKVAYARPAGENRRNNNLYVAHLPHNYSETEVRQLFSPYGEIVQCRVIGNRGVAFVLYDLQQQAKTAIDNLNGITLPESANPLSVKVATDANSHKHSSPSHSTHSLSPISSPPPRLYGQQHNPIHTGHQLSPEYAPNASQMFYNSPGPVRTHNNTNRSNRYNPMSSTGHLPHTHSHSHTQHTSNHSYPYQSQSYQPPPASPYQPLSYSYQSPTHSSPSMMSNKNGSAGKVGSPGYTLFVYNIGEADEITLERWFASCGRVIKCNVIRKGGHGESKGFGFVTMQEREDAENAIAVLNGMDHLSGKPLQVSFKK